MSTETCSGYVEAFMKGELLSVQMVKITLCNAEALIQSLRPGRSLESNCMFQCLPGNLWIEGDGLTVLECKSQGRLSN